MQNYPQLSSPPIKEVVLEFQFQENIQFSEEYSNQIQNELKSKFSQIEIFSTKSIGIDLFNNKTNLESETMSALTFINKDEQIRLNISKDRVSMNKLSPYDNFDKFTQQFRTYWEVINKNNIIKYISRVGLRYINEIETTKNIDYYLKKSLSTLDLDKVELKNSIHRFELKEINNIASIITIIEDNDRNKLIFDSDCFSSKLFLSNDEKLWTDVLSRLRVLKNNLFFNTFTKEFIEGLK